MNNCPSCGERICNCVRPNANNSWTLANSVLGSSWDPILQQWQHPPGRDPNKSYFAAFVNGLPGGSFGSLGFPPSSLLVHKMMGLIDEEEQDETPAAERPEPQTFVGHITGYRSWAVEPCGDPETGEIGWRLCSYSQQATWPARKRMEATCSRPSYLSTPEAHLSPDEDCECGIWAVKEAADAPTDAFQRDSVMVLGTVALWGKVHEQQLGWRAQYAYPQELWMRARHRQLAGQLARIYGVRVKIMNEGWIDDSEE